MSKVHPALAPAVTAALGTTLDAKGNPILGPDTAKVLDYLNHFKETLDEATATVAEQASQLQQHADVIAAQTGLLQQQAATIDQLTSVLNGKASAGSLADVRQKVTALATSVDAKADAALVNQQLQAIAELDASQASAIHQAQQLLATDGGLLQGLLAAQTTLGNQVSGLRTDVDLKAATTTVSTLTGQVTSLRNTVGDAGSGLAATYALAAGALPLAGGTLSGPVYVQSPVNPASPLQASTLPLSMTFNQALPLIALGGLYAFTVAVVNAVVGQVVVLNLPPAMLSGGASYQAAVTAAGTVTVTLKAGAQIGAGTQTFYLRVLR